MNTPATPKGLRLDHLLVERGLAASRSRARDAILRGTVTVDGQLIAKPGQIVSGTSQVALNDPAQPYVSRAALKLKAALEHFGISVEGRIGLDVGASTGGFTQVLLERGAKHVDAIDVGRDQLAPMLRADPRVTSTEGLNARDLDADHLNGIAPEIVTSDLSFISLKLALPPVLNLAAPGADAILLVKPQFEVGRERVGKGGLVSKADGEACAADLAAWLSGIPGWRVIGTCPSPIAGGDGNGEYLLAGHKA
ncbi:TlyA family RNA methyltransferase [Oricola cellulosilytica]|uniref:TlyA family RNA methyltransferase n=1 Tax=Oricola cellulosilytica TaxID=1429082 RepID=A0A4R0PAW6_9HYPH|nr:TlyA family RNA methyltransferase [Oricola cellulosilytica]TCD13445.1 TlyA family RNA methyltransferase [Oricola cellulosilytica]